MHIPNGFLSDPLCAITTAVSAATCGAGLWHARRTLDARGCQSLAAASAAIFAAQMINFPVGHGTSGHLLGAAAVALVLGPWTAMLAMGIVLAVQAALFGDGSLATWGANLLTMGIVAPWTAWGVSRLVTRWAPFMRWTSSPAAIVAGAALGALAGVVAAAGACSLELAAAGTVALSEVLPAVLRAHVAVGLSEALLTAALVAAFQARANNLPLVPNSIGRSAAQWTIAASAALALLLAPWASTAPDGLESVAARLGFAELAFSGWAGLAPDYALSGVSLAPAAIALAGLIGVASVVVVGYVAGRAATYRLAKTDASAQRVAGV